MPPASFRRRASEAAAAVAGKTQVLVVGGRNADGVLATADLVDVDSGAVAQLALTLAARRRIGHEAARRHGVRRGRQ